MATFKGRGILWGVNSLNIASGSLTASCSFSSADYGERMNEETILDCTGEIATQVTYQKSQELSCEYVFYTGTNSGTATVTAPAVGDIVTITDASVAACAGTWLVTAVNIRRTNTGACTISLTLSRYPSITY